MRCFFNDRRSQAPREPAGPPPTPDLLAEARIRTTLGWKDPTDRSGEPFMANVEDVPGTIARSAGFDTHYISPDRVERLLREMEEVLVRAALDPDCAASDSGVRRGAAA